MRRPFVVACFAVLALDAVWLFVPPFYEAVQSWTPFILIGLAVTAAGWIKARSPRGGIPYALGALAGTAVVVAYFGVLILLYITEDEASDYVDPACQTPRREVISEILSRQKYGVELDEIYSSTVQSPELRGARYVAILFRLDGAYGDAWTGVWATDWRMGHRVILAVNDEAKQFTAWPEADKSHRTIASDGVTIERVKECTA